ncbi:hypothetical protein D8674_021654 [Pyrus ussuriensis x Pyrus communis]|uniref:Reverse transcriptase Ty1/copia-type domain-containing protein n=1 Tax=Pyrus ussuriensis x Pyrus communis TaxID=2448454 RepID=A0A5N5GHR4_9ROSA|nr:hypothetical protein D8674_021654 [Pyrus ussuriensis x Pyrus communis]
MLTHSKAGIYKPKVYAATKHPLPLDIDDVPTTYLQASKHAHWRSAMQDEFNALQSMGTLTLVHPSSSQNVVGCKWVFRVKKKPNGNVERFKACLVAKGYHQQEGIDFQETFILRSFGAPMASGRVFEECLQIALDSGALASLTASSSSNTGTAYRDLWQAIWRAQVPPKVKVCGWRICSDILPTRVNLGKKGIRIDASYPRCDALWETKIRDWRMQFFSSYVVCCSSWAEWGGLWFRHGEGMETIGQIERRWGCEVGKGVGGAGAVIRWVNGEFMVAGSWRSQGCCSIKQVELLAIPEGIRLALRFGLLKLQVETDSIEAKEASKVSDIQVLLSELVETTVSYVPRECNSVAHCVAMPSLFEGTSVHWFKEPPDVIRELLDHDMYPH